MGSVLSYFSSPSPLPPPSPSPSSPPPEIKYDVFLSFSGDDTRNNITSHLDKAFRDKGIDAFIDNRLRRGDEIFPSLLQAIEKSKISVVVFSENYANSRWCLEELVKILECKKHHGQLVIPIFYEVDPSDVRNQTGSYAFALASHQRRYKEDLDKVQKWRCALKEAASLSGSDSRVVVPESVLVEKIVEDVLERLNNNMPSNDNKQLVGIESKITEIEVMLRMGDQTNNGVGKVGICGIGGVGKTTLAKAVFDKIYYQFEGYYFIGSVREASEKKELNHLRAELYSAILKDGNAYIYPFTKKRFGRKKLLIVFDDVTSFRQIEDLIGDLDCFRLGSRIIITSRNRQVLKNCGVNDIYELKELCFNDSLKLFCWHAFNQNRPKVHYKELSKGVVEKVGGVPLALKVLGSFLLGKGEEVWESSMKKIENSLDKGIFEVLKISYDGLDPDQQRIFLDIACFFKGWDVILVKGIMEASPDISFTANGLSALTDACLIVILDNKLKMHDLLQALGKMIVQQESVNPGKRTRLWNYSDIYDVLTNATGTETIEGISLDLSKINTGDIHLHPCAFVNMHNMKFLRFYNKRFISLDKVHIPHELKFLLTKLRYLEWDCYPFKSLESHFHLRNLVILKLNLSKVEQLWSGVQQFDNLKEIDLGSVGLIRFPDLRAPQLERLRLFVCCSLTEMPSCFQHLSRLMFLDLSLCFDLTSVPELPKSLQEFWLRGCRSLQRLPELPNNLEEIDLSGCSSLIEIPSSIQHLTKLRCLDLSDCISLTSVPDCTSFISSELPNNLEELDLSGCSSFIEIPSFLRHLTKLRRLNLRRCLSLTSVPDCTSFIYSELSNNLEELDLSGCSSLIEIPSFIQHLTELRLLDLSHCISLTSVTDCTSLISLEHLDLSYCSKLERLPEFPNSIRELYLSGCGITDIPDSVCCLTLLEILKLDRNNFERIPESIINLSNLSSLDISYCERLKVLPKLPWAFIDAANCTSLQELSCPSFPNDIFRSDKHMIAMFVNCPSLDPNSLDNFLKDIQWEIKAQSLPCHLVYGGRAPLTICYSGSEIPKCFNFQSSGSFIDVNLPHDCIDYNFLGFAMCVVVSFHSFPDQCDDHYESPPINYENTLPERNVCECTVKLKKGVNEYEATVFSNFFGCYSLGSSYVFIGFGFNFFLEFHDNEFSFESFQVHNMLNRAHAKVEKCGAHFIFGKHVDSEEDEPLPKRLKHI